MTESEDIQKIDKATEATAQSSQREGRLEDPDTLDLKNTDAAVVYANMLREPVLKFPVIGIGASAGGLEAFFEFINAVDVPSGMAYVFVQHLPPEHESLMAEILSKRTSMPVKQVEDGMQVEVNHLYVIRPGYELTLKQGVFRLGLVEGNRSANRPIDVFFRSLAAEQLEWAVAILLSGMGSNGTAGAQQIKAMGGLCIAQDPDTAKFSPMPRHLIESGNADYVLRPGDMPQVLTSFLKHLPTVNPQQINRIIRQEQQHLQDIFAILRTRTKQDFSGYKKATVLRRVERRMGLTHMNNLSGYVQLLRKDSGEVINLSEDLLIHVTNFFRDPAAWESLRTQVIVPLIAARENGSSVRAWVTACSTGEEAYTLAMLLMEEMERVGKALDIKVFATDMSERSLHHARLGTFAGGIETDISSQRLERFFQREDSMYRVRQDLREHVVFAAQNVLQDPPFSRLDIITCRNLMIYLEPKIQQRLLALLHFGLREDGTLFLGTSETVSGAEELFDPIVKNLRIYRRVGPTRYGGAHFPIPAPISPVVGVSDISKRLAPTLVPPTLAQLTQRALLSHHTPAAVTVDQAGKIVFFHGSTEKYLIQPRGEATRDLLAMAKDGLRSAIRSALLESSTDIRLPVLEEGWIEAADGSRQRVSVTVSVLDAKTAPDYFVVSFEDRGPQLSEITTEHANQLSNKEHSDLQAELNRVKQELQTTIEELQTSNEEMKASNEEVMSMNEELQSTNEELETSKEEMQSLNEELSTVNAQLQSKMDELQGTSNDLSSLLTSTEIAVIFLDTHLRIRRFTPAIKQLLDLISSDVGRPLSDLARKFTDAHLEEDAKTVLDRLVTMDREIKGENGQWYMRRVLPYRTTDNRIDGVVLVFLDITHRKQSEAAIRTSSETLSQELEAMQQLQRVTTRLFSVTDRASALQAMLEAMLDIFGADMGKVVLADEQAGSLEVATSQGLDENYLALYRKLQSRIYADYHRELQTGLNIVVENISTDRRHGKYSDLAKAGNYTATVAIPLLDHNEKLLGYISAYFKQAHQPLDRQMRIGDILARQAAALLSRIESEHAMNQSHARFRLVANLVPDLLWQNDAKGNANWFNHQWLELTGATMEMLEGQGWWDFVHHDDRENARQLFSQSLHEGEPFRHELRLRKTGGQYRWFVLQSSPLLDDANQVLQWFGAATDIHEARTYLQELQKRELHQRLTLDDVEEYAIFMIDTQGIIKTWNTGATRLLGFSEEEMLGQPVTSLYAPSDHAEEEIQNKLDAAAKEGKISHERWYLRKDGTRFWGSSVITTMRDEQNNVRGFTKVMHDTTTHRMMDQANERLAGIVESSKDAIISFTMDGKIISWNPAAASMFGYSPEETENLNIRQLWKTDKSAEFQRFMNEVHKGRITSHLETQFQDKQGKSIAISMTASQTHDMQGETIIGAILHDITDRQLHEQALLHAKNAAEEASRIKDEFLATLSHELRTPLAAILLWSKMLKSLADGSEEFKEGIQAIQNSAEAQKALIEDLLDTSRISSGTLRLQLRKANPAELIQNVIEGLEPAAAAKRIKISRQLSTDIKLILADPDRLRQVIWNLLSNAVKFCNPGGQVNISLEYVDQQVEIEVSDDGLGISGKFLPHIFEPFRQEDSTSTRRSGGLGLGLSICKQLVEFHGGTISVTSPGIGKGSTFTVRLPYVPVKDESIQVFPNSEPKAAKVLKNIRVLLIEDDPAMRQALMTLMKDNQIKTDACASIEDGLEKLHAEDHDIVICDICLPDKDGYHLLEQLKASTAQEGSHVPVIALTSQASPKDQQKAMAAGFSAWLSKPIDPTLLFGTMTDLLNGS